MIVSQDMKLQHAYLLQYFRLYSSYEYLACMMGGEQIVTIIVSMYFSTKYDLHFQAQKNMQNPFEIM